MDSQTKKALALIAAELHVQNVIAASKTGKQPPLVWAGHSSKVISAIADHFAAYFEGAELDIEAALRKNSSSSAGSTGSPS